MWCELGGVYEYRACMYGCVKPEQYVCTGHLWPVCVCVCVLRSDIHMKAEKVFFFVVVV